MTQVIIIIIFTSYSLTALCTGTDSTENNTTAAPPLMLQSGNMTSSDAAVWDTSNMMSPTPEAATTMFPSNHTEKQISLKPITTTKSNSVDNGNKVTMASTAGAVSKATTGTVKPPPPPSLDIWHLGVYGTDCAKQIYVWMYDNYDYYAYSDDEITCACTGLCVGAYTASPGTAQGYAAWIQGAINRAINKALNTNAVLIAFTYAVVILGLAGSVVLKINWAYLYMYLYI